MEAQFEAMEGRLEELTVATAQPEIIADVPKWQAMLKEMSQLEPAVNAWRQYKSLLAQIEQTLNRGLHRCKLLLPYAQGGRIEQLHEKAQVLSCEYTGEGIAVEAIVPEALFGQLRDWVVE